MPDLSGKRTPRVAPEVLGRAQQGDRDALGEVLEVLAGPVRRLCGRMVWEPADADDAAQEILLKVLTKLGSFRGESQVWTWVYRIALNHLLSRRPTAFEASGLDFDTFAADLADGLGDPATSPDADLLADEVRVGCTLGMLQCLDRDHRLAWVLGVALGVPGDIAADVIGVTPAAYRKRLSRARAKLSAFVNANCGLVEPSNPCRCHRRTDRAVELGRVVPGRPRFGSTRLSSAVAEMRFLHDASALFAAIPDHDPRTTTALVRSLLDQATTVVGDHVSSAGSAAAPSHPPRAMG